MYGSSWRSTSSRMRTVSSSASILPSLYSFAAVLYPNSIVVSVATVIFARCAASPGMILHSPPEKRRLKVLSFHGRNSSSISKDISAVSALESQRYFEKNVDYSSHNVRAYRLADVAVVKLERYRLAEV